MSTLYTVTYRQDGLLRGVFVFASAEAAEAFAKTGGVLGVDYTATCPTFETWEDFVRDCLSIAGPEGYEVRFNRPAKRSIAYGEGRRGRAMFVKSPAAAEEQKQLQNAQLD